MKHTIILTAGGIGKRMGGETPKQFLTIKQIPILIYNLQNIYSYNKDFEIIITLPKEWISHWKELLIKHKVNIQHKVINGGDQRFYSVKNAIAESTGDTIAIHDGVRPFVSLDVLNRIYKNIINKNAIVPYIHIKDSLREINGEENKSRNRNEIVIIQTPQCFKRETIVKAYKQTYKESFTDDASVVESIGESIFLIEGNEENIKITSPKDIPIAEAILKSISLKK